MNKRGTSGRIAAFFDLDGTLIAEPSAEWRFFANLRQRRAIPMRNYLLWLVRALWLAPRGLEMVRHANKMYLRGLSANGGGSPDYGQLPRRGSGQAEMDVPRFFPAESDEPSPYYYRIESRDQIRIMNEIDDAGLDLIGIYHSHVSSPAYPSRTDAEQAFWPDAVYVIVSLASPDAEVRGYRIRDMEVTEEELELA